MIDDIFGKLSMNDIRRELEVLRSEMAEIKSKKDLEDTSLLLNRSIERLDKLIFAISSSPSR